MHIDTQSVRAVLHFLALLLILCAFHGLGWLAKWAFYFLSPLPSVFRTYLGPFRRTDYWAQARPLPLAPRFLAVARHVRSTLRGYPRRVVEAAGRGNTVEMGTQMVVSPECVWPPPPQVPDSEPPEGG